VSRIAIVCARGGSKGVVRKNLRSLGGQPLVGLTVNQALDSGLFACVAVSSDCPEILSAARSAGAHRLVRRPDELAGDHISAHPAILHCLAACESDLGTRFDSITCLQVTSPFRATVDVVNAVQLQQTRRVGSVITGCAARNSPYFSMVEERPDGSLKVVVESAEAVVRRQDAPRCWDLNGAVYVFERDRYVAEQHLLYEDSLICEMPAERSLDIDTEFDLLLARTLWDLAARRALADAA